ncbi:MAG: HAD-IA family hydrolase [Firmicutes bacterium]|nr:HAD-IA family hydrolase [Bacillota bacterium]
MVNTIIFDLSEVIIAGLCGVEKLIESNKGIPAQEFSKRVLSNHDVWRELMRGNITEDEYISKLLEGANWDISHVEFKNFFRKNMESTVDGTLSIIQKLKGKYRLILLSDHVRECAEFLLAKHPCLAWFDKIIWSHEIGQIKVDDGTFDKVLKMIGATAQNVLFIDDSPANIQKAKQIGIQTILFTSADKLGQELLERHYC